MENHKNGSLETEILEHNTNLLIADLQAKGFKVDCFSYRRDGEPTGIATADCEIAIDFFGEGEYEHQHLMVVEENPYDKTEGRDSLLRRAKYVL